MEIEYIDMRDTLPSGGSVKITIPMKIVKEIWKKTEEKLSEGRPGVSLTFVKKFPVCFFKSDKKIILDLPENVISSREYPVEVVEKVKEEMIKYQAKIFAKQYEDMLRNLVTGKISKYTFEKEVKRILGNLNKVSEGLKQILSQRDLRFIATVDLERLLVSMTIEEEKEREERFLSLMDEVKSFKEDIENIKELLKKLEHAFKEERINKKYYEIVRERYQGHLTLAERRLDRLRKLVNDP